MICLNTRFPKARYDHECQDCGLLIPAGTKYRRDTMKEDSVQDYISHPECHNESARIFASDDNSDSEWGEYWLLEYEEDWSPEYRAFYEALKASQTVGV